MNTRRIALIAVFSSLALIISLFESLLPPILPILPFAKIGISHIIIFSSLVLLGTYESLFIFVIRSIFVSIFVGNPSMLLYSLPAGLVSLSVMILLLRTRAFGIPAINMASGAIHNLIQIIVAAMITGSSAVFVYIPYLMTFGAIAGGVTGVTSYMLIKKIPIKLIDNRDEVLK